MGFDWKIHSDVAIGFKIIALFKKLLETTKPGRTPTNRTPVYMHEHDYQGRTESDQHIR